MTLGEMRALLAAEDIRLTRSLGQNFLHDGNQLRRMVALAGVVPGDSILEIGPGLGPLTGHLLAAGARVLAVEKDARLVTVLRRRYAGVDALELVEADALAWLAANPRDWSAWKVVANLPYSVGSPILVELAQAPRPPASLTVTLQAEVVDRIRAVPSTPDYGVLTLLLARAFAPGPSFRIPATCFFPAPDVASACVRLERLGAPLVSAEQGEAWTELVKRAFSHRRKQLRKNLRDTWPEATVAAALQRLQVRAEVRAEALAPAQFAALLAALGPGPRGVALREQSNPG